MRSHKVPLFGTDFVKLEALFRSLEADAERALRATGATGAIHYTRSVEARFIGQGSETVLPIPEADMTRLDPATVRKRFDDTYAALYGRTYPESPVEFVNFCVRASLPVQLLSLPKIGAAGGRKVTDAIKGERPAWSARARGFRPYVVYDRYKLFEGAEIHGPAIVEERESTVIVGENATARTDEYGFLWIDLHEEHQK